MKVFAYILPIFRAGQEFKKKSCQFDKIVGKTRINYPCCLFECLQAFVGAGRIQPQRQATGICLLLLLSAYDRTNHSQPASPYPRTEQGEAPARLTKQAICAVKAGQRRSLAPIAAAPTMNRVNTPFLKVLNSIRF
ncbi:hypothetical protein [Allocoleopsis franciscana]|uniref:Uncharacterized protein n=1 Tax=Allocoleopsis franciscana PCC 7113 TaxID=1173027 RepID=K9WG20_9CYAN|nr:hypothetical protein [Allocoleopsis franciscana]AFZ19365.1 hypothetical protein Mic7113_3641 [Allocoleopsis franciscana PCC 7113]